MNSKKVLLISVLALLTILLVACGPNNQEAILGEWNVESSNTQEVVLMDFQAEGHMIIWYGKLPIEGSYTWVDSNTIQITMTNADQTQEIVADVNIRGDRMTLTNEDGDVDTLVRVK